MQLLFPLRARATAIPIVALALSSSVFLASAAGAASLIQGTLRTATAIIDESNDNVPPFGSGPGFDRQEFATGLDPYRADWAIPYLTLDGYRYDAELFHDSSVEGREIRAKLATLIRTDDTFGLGNGVTVNLQTTFEAQFQVAGTTRFELDATYLGPDACATPCAWARLERFGDPTPLLDVTRDALAPFGEPLDGVLHDFEGILTTGTYRLQIYSLTTWHTRSREYPGDALSVRFALVPEPTSGLLFGCGLLTVLAALHEWRRAGRM